MWAKTANEVRWSWRKNAPDLLALLTRNYPRFMFEANPPPLRDEIPVFTFHSVEPEAFRRALEFLQHNQYRTLDGTEFHAVLQGTRSLPERSVMLTFDDGRATLYTVVFPLLKKFGYKAVSFIIPGLIPDSAPPSPNYDDYASGQVSADELLAREQSRAPLCSWEEITEMHESGVIDFQSHTMYHHQACVSEQLIDFMHPEFDPYFFGNIAIPAYRVNSRIDYERQLPLGTPLYRAEPRMAGHPQYFDNESLRATCVQFVAAHGGEAFFRHSDWRTRLQTFYQNARPAHNRDCWETVEDYNKDISQDLQQSKQIIEERLSGKSVTQLCFPWFMGSEIAVRAARESGYSVNYWGIVPQRPTNRQFQDPYHVPRLEDRYLWRLPGEGRKSLREILQTKFTKHLPALLGKLH